jgi:hypothetical protein
MLVLRVSRAAAIGVVLVLTGMVTLAGSAAVSQQQPAAASVASTSRPDGVPVTVARAMQYDVTSRINGQTYRLMVSTPFKADPAMAYPVLSTPAASPRIS